jgi:hypothetical protein
MCIECDVDETMYRICVLILLRLTQYLSLRSV